VSPVDCKLPKTARSRGISRCGLGLRVRKLATEAPLQPLVSESQFSVSRFWSDKRPTWHTMKRRLAHSRPRKTPPLGESCGGVPGPCALGERDTLLWGRWGNASDGDVFRNHLDQIALRSQFGHQNLRGKARGEYRVSLLTPVTQPRLAHDLRGFL
jgi:hypothetical protein